MRLKQFWEKREDFLELYSRLSIVSKLLILFTLHLCISRTAHNTTLITIALFSVYIYLSVACQISNFLLLMKIMQINTKNFERYIKP